jgi:hypothetical protein
MPLSKAPVPPSSRRVDKKAQETRPRGGVWAGLGVGQEGEGGPARRLAKTKYIDLTYSYIVGKAAD